jgi:hypothetical protein
MRAHRHGEHGEEIRADGILQSALDAVMVCFTDRKIYKKNASDVSESGRTFEWLRWSVLKISQRL